MSVRQRIPAFLRDACVIASLVMGLWAASGQAGAAPTPSQADDLAQASALIREGAYDRATVLLRSRLRVDPSDRRAKEMLAFALESQGDLEGERAVRRDLAMAYPQDPGLQAGYARVLERSRQGGAALSAYRRARALTADDSAQDLDAAIERMRGRTALEVAAPLLAMSDPDARSSGLQAGVSIPFGAQHHVTLLGRTLEAEARIGPAASRSTVIGVTLARLPGTRVWWMAGPRVHIASRRGEAGNESTFGGAVAGRAVLGPSVEADASAEWEGGWDESAATTLHGGRASAAEGRVYAHGFARRLILQAGARTRRLTVLAGPLDEERPEARQHLWVAGADFVAWRDPRYGLQGEMLDDALLTPAVLTSALTFGYRHYDVTSTSDPAFTTRIALAPRARVDEASVSGMLASAGGRVGIDVRAGLGRDAARGARLWRAGAGLHWAPTAMTRITLQLERAMDLAAGFSGERREGRLSLHVDL